MSPDEADEERRLLYVAMTRATDSLTISWSPNADHPSSYISHLWSPPPPRPTAIDPARPRVPLSRRLNNWRIQVAKQRGIQSHLVLTDREIRKLCNHTPATRTDLAGALDNPLVPSQNGLLGELWQIIESERN